MCGYPCHNLVTLELITQICMYNVPMLSHISIEHIVQSVPGFDSKQHYCTKMDIAIIIAK